MTAGADGPPAGVAEEALRLLEALDERVPDWLRQDLRGWSARLRQGGLPERADLPDLGGALMAAASALGASAEHVRQVVDESLATGSPECRLCPICRLISLVRDRDDAEARRIGEALGTVGAVALGLLDSMLDDRRRHAATADEGPVEHIDIG
jgi:hypothetical protein